MDVVTFRRVQLSSDPSAQSWWPLTASVDVDESTVHWGGFRMGHRDWDQSELGPFVFDRDQYELALGRPARGAH